MYQLGQHLREHYGSRLFNNTYVPNKVVALTGDRYNRTIASAITVMAGMFPPENPWSTELLWRPVPVRTDLDIDNADLLTLLSQWPDDQGKCPRLAWIKTTDIYKQEMAMKQDLMQYISTNGNIRVNSLIDLCAAVDNFKARAIHINEHPLPPWMNMTFFALLQRAQIPNTLRKLYDFEQLTKLSGGMMLKKISTVMQNIIAGRTDHQFIAYSGHDQTLISIEKALQINAFPSNQDIGYGGYLAFELYKSQNGTYFVQLMAYDGSRNRTLIEANKCASPCEFQSFLQSIEATFPLSWNAECGLADPAAEISLLQILVGVMTVILIFVSEALLITCCLLHNRQWQFVHRRKGYVEIN
uniref:2-phosphoxylose phosphatase 1 n=1 Tax=Plectus sambesii TaxID=2011161 RepID=A0A914XSF1_9BILA